jgi:hypothetical protein
MSKLREVILFHLLFFISVSFLIARAYAGNPKIDYEVVTRSINADDEDKVPENHFYVIKKSADGQVDKNFHEVKCIASDYIGSSGDPGHCSSVTLPDGKFLLADCFSHNSICYSCILLRFNVDGSEDLTFKSPFTSSLSQIVNGSPEHEIKNIKQVSMENGLIRIDGDFISSLIGWSSKQAETDIGDRSGKAGTVFLKKDGQFDSFIMNKKH